MEAQHRRAGTIERSLAIAFAYSALVIVWVSSFPRSGNTFLRIVLNWLYGLRTSVVYDVDGVAERLGSDLVGFAERPAPIEVMRESHELYFVKTHRQRDDQVEERDRAVCLVRDGCDALVSWARMASELDGERFEAELRALISRQDVVGTGSWGRSVLSWLLPPTPHRVVLMYEALARDPRAAVEQIVAVLAPGLRPLADVEIPSFADLQQTDDRFFRRELTASHREEVPDDLHQLFGPSRTTSRRCSCLATGAHQTTRIERERRDRFCRVSGWRRSPLPA